MPAEPSMKLQFVSIRKIGMEAVYKYGSIVKLSVCSSFSRFLYFHRHGSKAKLTRKQNRIHQHATPSTKGICLERRLWSENSISRQPIHGLTLIWANGLVL